MKSTLIVMLVATWFVSPMIAGHLADNGHYVVAFAFFAFWAWPIGKLLVDI